MVSGNRRDAAARIIAGVIARVGRADEKRLRQALRDAYPWGERRYWPYKVWLSEIKCQIGARSCEPTPDLFSTTTKEIPCSK